MALLYKALAIGPMSVVAPVTAVCAVIVPLVVGLLQGEQLATLAALGVAVAIVAVGLLGMTPAARRRHAAEPTSPAACASRWPRASPSAGSWWRSARPSAAAGLWPLAVSRVVSVDALHRRWRWRLRQALVVPRSAMAPAIACGGLDMVANALYLVAVREGQLSLIATLASLYPASTVLLARVVLGERLGRWQQVGVASAVAAIVLIVANS